jgi:alcohol dehydrogenase class IV
VASFKLQAGRTPPTASGLIDHAAYPPAARKLAQTLREIPSHPVTPARVDVFRIPTRISFGRGVALTVATPLQQVNAKRVLIVTDKGVLSAGLVAPVEERLREARFACAVYDDVVPDPGVNEVQRCYERARDFGADSFVAVGGGSSIDTAKMAATLLANGGTVLDYVGVDKVPKPAAPVVAIPTTAGTGAEITINSVIADPAQHKKLLIISPNATALFALEDPEMTRTCPPFVTAITGMDTLTHAIESFVCKNAYPMTKALCLEAIREVGGSLAHAVKDGSDIDMRERMMRAVVSASLAFSNTRLGNVHAMALPLGGWCHIAHGTAVAVLLPHVMDFNRSAAADAYAIVGDALGVRKDAQAAIGRIVSLNEEIGIKPTLSAYGASAETIPNMAKDAMQSGNILVNPRETKLQDLESLYRAAL